MSVVYAALATCLCTQRSLVITFVKQKFLTSDMLSLKAVLSTSTLFRVNYEKHTPGWAFIRVTFDPIQEIGPKVGVGTLSSLVYAQIFYESLLNEFRKF